MYDAFEALEQYNNLELGEKLAWGRETGKSSILKHGKEYTVIEILPPVRNKVLRFRLRECPEIVWDLGAPFKKCVPYEVV